MKNKIASPPWSACGVKALIPAALLALSFSAAQAAISFADSATDAGSSYGSAESISGLGFLFINGTSNDFLLEAVDPGLKWSNFKLTVYDVTTETAAQSPAATANINGVAATSSTFASTGPNPLGLTGLGDFYNIYEFSFANLALAAGNYKVALGGFNSVVFGFNTEDLGGAVLTATAVPEPSTYALLFAGLAAVGWVARRKTPGGA
jgi:hypothetical protein